MTLLVRGRRLAAGLNPERRVSKIDRREADARAAAKEPILCPRHANQPGEKKDPTRPALLLSAKPAVAPAHKTTATREGPSSRLPTRMRPASTWGRECIMWRCPKAGPSPRCAALGL